MRTFSTLLLALQAVAATICCFISLWFVFTRPEHSLLWFGALCGFGAYGENAMLKAKRIEGES